MVVGGRSNDRLRFQGITPRAWRGTGEKGNSMTTTTGTGTGTGTAGTDWQAWQRSWDRQQEWYMPDREERFRTMLDMVEAFVGPEPRVLDLACGTGSITARL